VTLAVSASAPVGTLVVTVIDARGRIVADVYLGPASVGDHRYMVDTRGWAAGLYVAQALADGHPVTTRFTVAR
jgi:hypothetical protein